ncbi:hypothetical protein BH11PLA2_BH11PLA2_10840 [soil metagenome]
MLTDHLADKVPCTKCGTLIQTTTAHATGGICRSCERGRLNCVRCSASMVRRDMIPDDQQICRDCRKKEMAAAPKPVEVEYNGVIMMKSWVDSIISAQEIRTVELRAGEKSRVTFGEEKAYAANPMRNCPDCAVIVGQYHVPSCDTEECPNCKHQLISCGCLLEIAPE